jgi:hypothetical protein
LEERARLGGEPASPAAPRSTPHAAAARPARCAPPTRPASTLLHPLPSPESDRLFEANFDDDVAVLGALMPTTEFANYLGMAAIAGLGVAGFAAKAYQDRKTVERIQILTS